MRALPRPFPPDMPPSERRVYGAAAGFYLLLFLLLVWPVYPRFASARPFVLGMPLSLVYVVALVSLSFLVLLGLFLWEGRRRAGRREREGGRPAARADADGTAGRADAPSPLGSDGSGEDSRGDG